MSPTSDFSLGEDAFTRRAPNVQFLIYYSVTVVLGVSPFTQTPQVQEIKDQKGKNIYSIPHKNRRFGFQSRSNFRNHVSYRYLKISPNRM